MRLFIAINFSDTMRNELLAILDKLRSESKHGRFTEPENLHLTLAFLGECNNGQAAAAKDAMDTINFEPFQISIGNIGRFKRDGGDIWWAGILASKPLINLQKELIGKLTAEGFIPDKRKYKPHITLGRKVVTNTIPWQATTFCETVTCIDLTKSERVNGKLTYIPMHKKIL